MQRKKLDVVKLIGIAIFLLVGLISYLYTNELWIFKKEPVGETESYVDFIDCGQGDSTLIVSNGSATLIDATTGDHAEDIIAHLERRGVKKIDHFVLTHPHDDHIGGAVDVLDAVDVGRIYMKEPTEGTEPTNSVYMKLLNKIDEENHDILLVEVGDTFDCGDFRFTVLGPIEDYTDLNSQSIVMSAVYNKASFLFTGDQESPAERDLAERYGADLRSTVLKLGHHGSSGSSCAAFLDAVAPRYAVISCGYDNRYGHPHDETLDRMEEYGITYYRTDFDGTVTAYTDGNTVSFESEGEE